MNNAFSSWSQLLRGVPQGSVVGPILFNIYLNDLFCLAELTNVCNFADDTTLFSCDLDLSILLNRLEHDTSSAIEWFDYNYLKLNEDKCHLIISGHKFENVWVKIGDTKIWESQRQKLLGVDIDRQLKFDNFIFSLCKKASRKLSALARLSSYLKIDQKRVLMKYFIESQFSYCPLTWMYHGRKASNRINHLHERALRIVYNDNISSFEELLRRDDSCSIHHKNLKHFAIELYKVQNNLSTPIMNELFEFRDISYQLRNRNDFSKVKVNTVSYGLNSLKYFATKVWDMVPTPLKCLDSVEAFKNEIKKWTPTCDCKLCQTYIEHIGYCNVVN